MMKYSQFESVFFPSRFLSLIIDLVIFFHEKDPHVISSQIINTHKIDGRDLYIQGEYTCLLDKPITLV